jgi:hypothetical protein
MACTIKFTDKVSWTVPLIKFSGFWKSPESILDRVPSPTGDLSQRIRVRRRRRRWTTAALVRRDRREANREAALQYSRLL